MNDLRKKALHSLKSKSLSEDLAPMEVTVGADSEEGLEKGLDLAKDVVKEVPHDMLGSLDEDLDLEENDLEEEADEILAKLQESPELMKMIVAKLSL